MESSPDLDRAHADIIALRDCPDHVMAQHAYLTLSDPFRAAIKTRVVDHRLIECMNELHDALSLCEEETDYILHYQKVLRQRVLLLQGLKRHEDVTENEGVGA